MGTMWIALVEEKLNAFRAEEVAGKERLLKINPELDDALKRTLGQLSEAGKKETPLYDVIRGYVMRLDPEKTRFFHKNGEINDAEFYRYAMVDKSSWSAMRWEQVSPSKEALLRMVFALHLNREEAEDLLRRGSKSFNPRDYGDQIMLALIELKCYDLEVVYEVLEKYRTEGPRPFKNIFEVRGWELEDKKPDEKKFRAKQKEMRKE